MLTKQQVTEEIEHQLDELQLKYMARQVTDQEHFWEVLNDAKPSLRRQVYEAIKPHLRFRPKPYCLMKFTRSDHPDA